MNPFDNTKEKKPVPLYAYPVWAAIGAASAFLLTLVFNLLKLTEAPSYTEVANGQFFGGLSMPAMIGLYCIAAPIGEEVLFRFLLFNFLEKLLNTRVAIPLTAIAFGIYHQNPVQVLYGFLMGLIITCGYAKHRNLLIPILAHAAANAVALAFTFV